MVERHVVRELMLGRGNAEESIRALAELWWRAVYGLAAAAVIRGAWALEFHE